VSSARTASGSLSAHSVARQVADSRWGDRALRAGLAARGVVFLIFAELVARVALGALGQPSTSKPAQLTGVPEALADEPGGRTALFVLAVGMVLYALFSLVDAIRHHDDERPAAKRWGDRVLSAFGFLMYAAFGSYSFAVALSGPSNTSSAKDNSQQTQWRAAVLRAPAGWLWLGLLATVLIAIAGFLVSRAARRSFGPRFERRRMSNRTWRVTMVLGTVGYLGRAALFAVVGGCIMSATVDTVPSPAEGVECPVR
jgi:hypothetical protein